MSTTIEELRPRAFAIAYRMLGRVSDAEDIVQEALLRVDPAGAHQRETVQNCMCSVQPTTTHSERPRC